MQFLIRKLNEKIMSEVNRVSEPGSDALAFREQRGIFNALTLRWRCPIFVLTEFAQFSHKKESISLLQEWPPDLHCPILATGDDFCPIRRPGHIPHGIFKILAY